MGTQDVKQLRQRIAELERELADARAGLVRVGNATLNVFDRTVMVDDRSVVLLGREMALLLCLARHAGELTSKADLLRAVGGEPVRSDTNVVAVHVSRLRSKLGGSGLTIVTDRGRGYRLSIDPDVKG